MENESEIRPSTSGSTEIQYSDVTSSDTRLIVKIDTKKRNNSSEKKLKKKIEYLKRVKCTVEKRNHSSQKVI